MRVNYDDQWSRNGDANPNLVIFWTKFDDFCEVEICQVWDWDVDMRKNPQKKISEKNFLDPKPPEI